jgi:hypothetical protein
VTNIKREVKSAEWVKQWMDDRLHESGVFEEYSFLTPVKAERRDENDSNWTFTIPCIHRSTNDPSPDRPVEQEVEAAFMRIWGEAASLLDLE